MKKLVIVSLFLLNLTWIGAQQTLDITSKESIQNWLNTHQFRAQVEGDFDMYIEIEHLDKGDALVLSNDHGKRKIFGQLTYQLNQSAPSVVGLGLEESSLEVIITPEGNLMTAGMTFIPVKE